MKKWPVDCKLTNNIDLSQNGNAPLPVCHHLVPFRTDVKPAFVWRITEDRGNSRCLAPCKPPGILHIRKSMIERQKMPGTHP